jgi:hypothetical protein
MLSGVGGLTRVLALIFCRAAEQLVFLTDGHQQKFAVGMTRQFQPKLSGMVSLRRVSKHQQAAIGKCGYRLSYRF